MAQIFVRGSILSYGGIVGSSHIMVSDLKWVIICESGKGPLWGLGLWYRFLSGITSNGDRVWVFFGCGACPMKGLLSFGVFVCVCIAIALPFVLRLPSSNLD